MSDTDLQAILNVVTAGFAAIDRRFEAIDQRFEAIDQRFEAIDRRFDAIDQGFEAIDRRFDAIDERLAASERRLDSLEDRMANLTRLVERLDTRVERLEQRIERLEQHAEKVDFRFDRMEATALATRTAIMERLDRVQNAVLEQKQRIDWFVHISERMETKMDRLHDDMEDVKERLSILDTSFGTWAQMVSNQNNRLARFDTRLVFVEKRLDLRDGPRPGADPAH
jgi:chromosome segregation ATPase